MTLLSAKVRTGLPLDDEADYDAVGVLPLKLVAGDAIADSRVPSTINLPIKVQNYRR